MSIARPSAAAGQAPARFWVCREWRASHEAPGPAASRPGRGERPPSSGADQPVRASAARIAHAGGYSSEAGTAPARNPGDGLALSGSGAHSPGAAPGEAPRRASTSDRRFSLLDRYVAGRELAAYIEAEFDRGRDFHSILEDEFAHERLAERPYLLEDLLNDQELAQRARRSDGTLDFDQLEAALGGRR
ncbi:MAG: hypothetical protein ACJ76V_15115 [Thermoleophilaceae bacterium]